MAPTSWPTPLSLLEGIEPTLCTTSTTTRSSRYRKVLNNEHPLSEKRLCLRRDDWLVVPPPSPPSSIRMVRWCCWMVAVNTLVTSVMSLEHGQWMESKLDKNYPMCSSKKHIVDEEDLCMSLLTTCHCFRLNYTLSTMIVFLMQTVKLVFIEHAHHSQMS